MFKLAFRMFCSDVRTSFTLWGWGMKVVLLFCVIIFIVTPLVDGMELGYMGYALCMGLMWLAPRFTKAYHVVPLTITQIKKLAVCRITVLMLAIIGSGCVAVAVAEIFGLNWNPRFGLWYFFYLELYMWFVKNHLRGFYAQNKKNLPLQIMAGIITIASIFVMIGWLDVLPLYMEYLIQTALLLLYVPYMVHVFKDMTFSDYTQITEGIGAQAVFME